MSSLLADPAVIAAAIAVLVVLLFTSLELPTTVKGKLPFVDTGAVVTTVRTADDFQHDAANDVDDETNDGRIATELGSVVSAVVPTGRRFNAAPVEDFVEVTATAGDVVTTTPNSCCFVSVVINEDEDEEGADEDD